MIKKILLIFIILLFFIPTAFWFVSNMQIELKDKETNELIDWKVIQVNYNNIPLKFVTNKGLVNFDFDFQGDDLWEFNIIINWNYLFLQNIWENDKKITIIYNQQEEKISDIVGANWKISNQEIIKITNYKLLILFVFFTIFIFTILFWWKLTYILLDRDVDKFKEK